MFHSEPPLGGKKLIDDGKDGSCYIWTVEGKGGNTKSVLPKEEWGQFYSKRR